MDRPPTRPSRGTPINPVITAEQALLGALLLSPELQAAVVGVVSPDDFYRPAHAALFAAITHGADNGPSPLAERVLGLLARVGEQAAGLTAVYAHTLMAACPHPQHAPTYARMVAEAATCRSIREHAHRLRQVATTDLERGGTDETLRHLDTLHRVLDHSRTRHPAPPGSPRMPTASPASPTGPDPYPCAEEQALLSGLAADPAQLDAITWLHDDDLIHPVHRVLLACLRDVHRRGSPVDPVTVQWEAHRTGRLTDAALADTAETLAGGIGVHTPHAARRVLRHALLHRTTAAADTIAALAAPQRAHPHHLATAARRLLAPVDTTRQRWHTATAPEPGIAAAQHIRGPTAQRPRQLPATAAPAHRR